MAPSSSTGFVQAFGDEAAVYVGGPDRQEAPGMPSRWPRPVWVVGSVTWNARIFSGGFEAIVDAVIDGSRSPLDFRFFVGRRTGVSTADGAWRPVACARPIALKQCLGLPKPLWHEVQELCGGELGELSKIELLKRTDLGQRMRFLMARPHVRFMCIRQRDARATQA